ncbi:hypothetical protein CW676_07745 [Macrococcoides caseolyticum]|uniref:hypothetical protein n=1 Tax=Macrococcoides caseolyticum TaxID=69966 RepID=UPI000C347760|nr:hypothetical protein [Macrococcus caseolyticus]PKE06424.1 hypothetical protein CW692_08295 [Macrococcus caseolyticus]PKE23547.1 hypothetical protein CW689_08375 [Macrococcus caseolyticus]PKE52885.1 hypothetical protein CW676_07745 [Macrococcus caseolyticus]PKF37879.1 hypothetical protein CW681_09630 [Macrococcus caseolyticus]
MKFNTTQKDLLKRGFTSALRRKNELLEEYKRKHPELYNEIIHDYLVWDGLPKDVKAEKVNYTVDISGDPEALVQILEIREIIQDEEQFKANIENDKFYIDNIIDVPMYIDMQVTIKTTVEEYMDKFPDGEYISYRLNNYYEEEEFVKFLEEKEDVKEWIKREAKQEGFPDDVDLEKLKYTLHSNVSGNQMHRVAEHIHQREVITEENPLSKFIPNELYSYIYNHALFDLRLELNQTPEEYSE